MDTDEERVNLEEVSANNFTALEDEARVWQAICNGIWAFERKKI